MPLNPVQRPTWAAASRSTTRRSSWASRAGPIYNRILDGRLQTIRTLGGSQRVTLASAMDLGVRRRPRATSGRAGRVTLGVVVTALVTLFLLATSVQPAMAQRRARLSEDLAGQLAAGSQTIDVIVQGDAAQVETLARKYNLRVKKSMRSGAVVRLNASQLAVLQADDAIDSLSGDSRVQSLGAGSNITAETIGADQVWAGAGDLEPLSGQGITVAVIDSGIDTGHAAFRNRVLASVDFTGGDGQDGYGHGTHVASLIMGRPGRAAETAGYRGMAYGAYLVNLRALGDDGSGAASDVIEAIDWAIEHRNRYNIRIINLSLGAAVMQPFADDPLCAAVERAVRAGMLVVAAAGNYGLTPDGRSQFGAITSPGNSPFALTVGALDTKQTPQRSDDTVATFSSKGPTRFDMILKPDVAAPGVRVVGAEAADSYLSQTYPERHVAGSGSDAYSQWSGTSMASAVVSGAAALLLDNRSSLRPNETMAALRLTSSSSPFIGILDSGSGELNALAAAEFVDNRFKGLLPETVISG